MAQNKIQCPNCNKLIYAQSEQCPYCRTRFNVNPAAFTKDRSLGKKLNNFLSRFNRSENRSGAKNNKNKKLLSLKEVDSKYKLGSQNYLGVKEVKLNDIIGSMDRYNDFNKYFLPVKGFTTKKLDPIINKMKKGEELPPVKLYAVSGKYFVIDGHHRISASLLLNREYIDAEVTNVKILINLEEKKQPEVSSEEMKFFIIDIERKEFEKKTYLYNNILSYPIIVTHISSYGKLYDDIATHHKLNCEINQNTNIIVSALEWYKHKFLPVINIIMDYGLMNKINQRTASDLYVWFLFHQYFLSMETGHKIGFKQTIADFVKVNGKKKYYDQIPTRFDNYINYILNER
ncbi:MAG TPA: ParB/RepB/Spo0J family partition protein [Spirochaetota bacterium]|nr:ParB/RepB/Spo0J family partition protein [Spirochaetota bacterium]